MSEVVSPGVLDEPARHSRGAFVAASASEETSLKRPGRGNLRGPGIAGDDAGVPTS